MSSACLSSTARVARTIALRRGLHTATTVDYDALRKWADDVKTRTVQYSERIIPERLRDLYATLPTRDGTRPELPPSASVVPKTGDPLAYGHHLVFFHPHSAEAALRWDGTDADACPPPPFTRRMWAAGEMWWSRDHRLLVSDVEVTADAHVAKVDLKGVERGTPMVFVEQSIEHKVSSSSVVAQTEKRTHVYLPPSRKARSMKQGEYCFHHSIYVPENRDACSGRSFET